MYNENSKNVQAGGRLPQFVGSQVINLWLYWIVFIEPRVNHHQLPTNSQTAKKALRKVPSKWIKIYL